MSEWINECDFHPKPNEIWVVLGRDDSKRYIRHRIWHFHNDRNGVMYKERINQFNQPWDIDRGIIGPFQFLKIENKEQFHEFSFTQYPYDYYHKKTNVPKFDWSYC